MAPLLANQPDTSEGGRGMATLARPLDGLGTLKVHVLAASQSDAPPGTVQLYGLVGGGCDRAEQDRT